MAVFFGHTTALAFWRSGVAPSSLPTSKATPAGSSFSKQEALGAASELNAAMFRASRIVGGSWEHPDAGLPLSIIADSAALRRNTMEARCRVWRNPGAKHSYLKVADGCYVARPETCFLQLADDLCFEELLLLGMELCGTYSIRPSAADGFVQRGWGQNLTTPVRLARYVESSSDVRGVVKARVAVKLLARGAASPAEAKTYLLLCLPFRYGGYGLAKPQMNPKLRIAGESYKVVPESTHIPLWEERRPDFLWQKGKVALEYDSFEHHSGTDALKRDSHRRGDLECADIHVITMTGSQLYSQQRFDKVARAIAKRTGKRLNKTPLDWSERQIKLRKAILPL